MKILVKKRITSDTKRINNSRNIVTIYPDDIVMARTTIQSNKTKDKVTKLYYAARGPFQIIHGIDRGNYIVWELNKTDSPEFKLISELYNDSPNFKFISELYILPPSLKTSQHVNSSDNRYSN